MTPKHVPTTSKQVKVLDWLKQNKGVYTLGHLEKLLPSNASINKMQVKEYLDSLTDESVIRCEKIGSGNWYWCFASDTTRVKEMNLKDLREEKNKIVDSIQEMQMRICDEKHRRADDAEMLVNNHEVDFNIDRDTLLASHSALVQESADLNTELGYFGVGDEGEIASRVDETMLLMQRALKWTDNIESLSSYLVVIGGRDLMYQTMGHVCGSAFSSSDGLEELVDL